MDNHLIEASQTGDIDVLYEIIGENPNVLKRIDEEMFVDTPLHIAASSGNTCFAMELLNLMPSFANKLNKSGLSPVHLALMTGNFRLVSLFLRANSDLVRVKGRSGLTPLHYATKYGKINLIAHFLAACPESIEDVTIQGETVLHIAVKSNMVEALEVLVGWIRRVCHKAGFYWQDSLPNWKDEQGKTVLDIAISMNQVEAITLLNQINAKNSKGIRASQFMAAAEPQGQGRNQRLLRLLVRAVMRFNLRKTKTIELTAYLKQAIPPDEILAVFIERHKTKMSDHARSALLVVAGLVLAATFQAAIRSANVFQTNGDNDNTTIDLTNANYTKSNIFNSTIVTNSTTSTNNTTMVAMVASIPISFLNSLTFSAVITIIGVLLPDGYIGEKLISLLIVMSVSYYASTFVTSTLLGSPLVLFFYLFFYLVSILLTVLSGSFLKFYWRGMGKHKLLEQEQPEEDTLSVELIQVGEPVGPGREEMPDLNLN